MFKLHDVRLNPCRAKIARAYHHLDEFARLLAEPRAEPDYGLAFGVDPSSREFVIRSVDGAPFFTELAILAGEIVHQARSALDHAIWIISAAPRAPVTGFPVFTPNATYPDVASLAKNKTYVGMVESIPEAARRLVDGFQPMFPAFQSNSLYILNELWKQEKHRLLNMVGVATDICQVYFVRPDGTSVGMLFDLGDGVLKHSAELVRCDLPPGVDLDAKVMPVTVSAIQFTESGPSTGRMAEPLLREVLSFADFILFRLDEAAAGEPHEKFPAPWFPAHARGEECECPGCRDGFA